MLIVHQVPNLGSLKKQVQKLGNCVDIFCYRPEVFELLSQSGYRVVAADSGCGVNDLKSIRELSLDVLNRTYEHTSPILTRKFKRSTNDKSLSTVHYNYYLNLALNSYLIPYYQLSGLLSINEYSEVVEARSEDDIKNFEEIFSGLVGDRPSFSTVLACQYNGIAHRFAKFNLYSLSTSPFFSRLRRGIKHRLRRLIRKFQPKAPNLTGNTKSIIPLSAYDFSWVPLKTWEELGFDLKTLPRKNLSNGYQADPDRVESLASSMKIGLRVWTQSNPDLTPEEKQLIDHVLSNYFDYLSGQLDLFDYLIQDKTVSYGNVRIMSAPTISLNDIVYVRSLVYLQAQLISWQHGGNYGYTELPIFLHHDLLNCDVFLSYGTSPKTYADNARSKSNGTSYEPLAEVKVLGSYKIPATVARRNDIARATNGKFQILYACRDYQPILNNLANAWIMTSLTYYDIQKEILTSLADLQWADVTVQPHPAESGSAVALREWADERDYHNVRFGKPGRFGEALERADMVICDFPSTSFIEALWSGLPVVVYQAFGSYEVIKNHFEDHSSNIQLVSTTEDLIRALKKSSVLDYAETPQLNEAPAFVIGRTPGFKGESELWRSILN